MSAIEEKRKANLNIENTISYEEFVELNYGENMKRVVLMLVGAKEQ